MLTLRLAFRNLLRNRGRTAITVTAVMLNTAILIASLALMDGMVAQTVHNATQLVVGQVQAHARGYLADRSMYKNLAAPEPLLKLASANGIHAAPRSFGFGLLSHGAKSAGASFWGVDPEAERAGFEIAKSLAAGQFLDGGPQRQVVLGRKLARSLDVAVGGELVAVVQAADGSLGNELYTVAGILKTVSDDVDRSAVILHRDDFARLFDSGGRVHEIAFNGGPGADADHIRDLLKPAAGDAELKTWSELLPAVSDIVALTDATVWIFGLVFVLAAGLGVLNTMLMATHDRVREYGVLKALGATALRTMADVLAEAFLLAVIACVCGAALGIALAGWLHHTGIDLSVFGGGSVTISGIAFNPLLRGQLSAAGVLLTVGVMAASCVLASIYPAVKVARLDPVRAMNEP